VGHGKRLHAVFKKQRTGTFAIPVLEKGAQLALLSIAAIALAFETIVFKSLRQ